jgi:hypothetical protein
MLTISVKNIHHNKKGHKKSKTLFGYTDRRAWLDILWTRKSRRHFVHHDADQLLQAGPFFSESLRTVAGTAQGRTQIVAGGGAVATTTLGNWHSVANFWMSPALCSGPPGSRPGVAPGRGGGPAGD